MNPEITRLIDRYLSGELTGKDLTDFETLLASNEDLQNEVNLQKAIEMSANRAGYRDVVEKRGKKYHFKKLSLKLAIAFALISSIALGTYFIINSNKIGKSEIDISAELKQQLTNSDLISDLKTQLFTVEKEGDILFTEENVLISVPEGAFLKNGKPYNGKVVIQFQEAIQAQSIIKAGLSTTTGDKLLETQGMFSLDGYTDKGEVLEINPEVGVYIQVPVDEYKNDMELYDGVKDKNGNIDWQNPKPLEKMPVLAKMRDLDFYPVGYEDHLDSIKWNTEKYFRDSLYLSFEEFATAEDCQSCDIKRKKQFNVPNRTLTVEERTAIYGEHSRRLLNINMQGWEYKELVKKGLLKYGTDENPFQPNGDTICNEYYSGAKLFKMKCAACHQLNQDGTGPKLAGIKQKWADGGASEDDLIQWVKDWRVAAKNSSYAKEVAGWSPTAMKTFPELSQSEVIRILNFIDPTPLIPADGTKAFYDDCKISPAFVLGFWNKKFNNTNLSTRDFEKRMRSIHETCNNDVLNLYVSNLDKSISETDRQLVELGYSYFSDFAAENIGKVDISNKHQQNLTQLYNQAIDKLKSENLNNHAKKKALQEKNQRELNESRQEEATRQSNNTTAVIMKEFDFNMRDIQRQVTSPTVGFTLSSGSGNIKNIDRLVLEKTIARESAVLTDPKTGQKVELKYDDLTFTVDSNRKFIKLFAYLLPKELKSYQRIDLNGVDFKYALNVDLNYNLLVIGVTEKGFQYYEKSNVKGQDLKTVKLLSLTEKELDLKIKKLTKKTGNTATKMLNEMDWLTKEKQNYVAIKTELKLEKFREGIAEIIFPCYSNGLDYIEIIDTTNYFTNVEI